MQLYFSTSMRSDLLSRYRYSDTSTGSSPLSIMLMLVRKASTSSVSGLTSRPISIWSASFAVSGLSPSQ